MSKAGISNDAIAQKLATANIEVPARAIEKLGQYLALLVKWNRVYNLTGLRDVDTLIGRHLLESLALRGWLHGRRIADVGTGAGLPGVPLAIVEPERRFTLIESRAKRVHFLRHVAGALPLPNVEVVHSRAEDLPSGSAFDTVLARAVAPPAELLAIARRLTDSGSILLVLTSAERSDAFRDLATDFVPKAIEPAGNGDRRSTIVQLERIDA